MTEENELNEWSSERLLQDIRAGESRIPEDSELPPLDEWFRNLGTDAMIRTGHRRAEELAVRIRWGLSNP